MSVKVKIVKNNITEKTKKYLKGIGMETTSGADFKAKKAVSIQALKWVVEGSPNVSRIPPVDTGALWASGTGFVGSVLTATLSLPVSTPGVATPNKSYNGKMNKITIGFNTPYAARWHEVDFNPGEISDNAGDVGTKYLEKHIQGDAIAYTKLYAEKLKKESGG